MARITKTIQSKKGYSMVELIVTLAILVIIATPLAGYFIVGAQNNRLAREQMQAGQLAQQVMEDWKAQPMIGNLSPADTVSGPFTISRRAVAVDRIGSDQITYIATQDPVEPDEEAPSPVQRSIENYQYSPVISLAGQAAVTVGRTGTLGTYSLNLNGTNLTNITGDFTLNVKVTSIDAITNQIAFTGAFVENVIYTPGVEPARIVFTMDSPAEITINVNSEGPPVDVYVYQGIDPATGLNYPDRVTVVPETLGVRGFENLQLSPGGFDATRVYQLTVTVTRNGNPLVRLEGYKEIQ